MGRIVPIILAAVISAVATWFIVGTPAQKMGHTKSTSAITQLTNEKQEISYALGYQYGQGLEKVGADEVDVDFILKGLNDALYASDKPLMDQTEVMTKLRSFFTQVQQAMKEEQAQALRENLEKGKAFLAQNKTKQGIQVTDSGLQYRILESGTGFPPSQEDTVVVEYTGKLIDGTVFQSTDEMGKPAEFRVGQVIKGWSEALQLMSPGAHYELFIPAELAYGPRGIPNVIGPNEVLIFDVKLVTIKDENEDASVVE